MELRHMHARDFTELVRIEQENFDPAEQIAEEILAYYTEAGATNCLVIEDNGQLAAYILAAETNQPSVTDTIFTAPEGMEGPADYLAIASLSVSSTYQQQGLGTLLLAGLKELAASKGMKGISLTCKESLISYYEMNGFSENGLSDSKFGGKIWYDMYWECP